MTLCLVGDPRLLFTSLNYSTCVFLFLFVYTKSLPFCAAELLPSRRTLYAKGTWWAATKGVVLRKPYFTGRKSDKSQDAKAETPDARLPALCINAYLYL